MKKVISNTTIFTIAVISILILCLAIFQALNVTQVYGYSPPKIIQAPTPAQPMQTAPVSYCEPPLYITNGFSLLTESVQIDGRNIVYSDGGLITFYDLGPDHNKSQDDLGLIYPGALQYLNGVSDSPKIYENSLIYRRYHNNFQGEELMFYSLGNDGIAGTSDDVGPNLLLHTPPQAAIRYAHIDRNFVSFYNYTNGTFNGYYCTIDNQECQNGIIHSLGKKAPGMAVGWANGAYWTYLFKNLTRPQDVYFEDSISIQPSLFLNGVNLIDSGHPFILFQTLQPRGLGLGIFGAPQFLMLLPNSINFSTAALPNHILSNQVPIAWSEYYPWNQTFKYKISGWPSFETIEVPPLGIQGNSHVVIDENTLVFTDGLNSGIAQIYASKCYFL